MQPSPKILEMGYKKDLYRLLRENLLTIILSKYLRDFPQTVWQDDWHSRQWSSSIIPFNQKNCRQYCS